MTGRPIWRETPHEFVPSGLTLVTGSVNTQLGGPHGTTQGTSDPAEVCAQPVVVPAGGWGIHICGGRRSALVHGDSVTRVIVENGVHPSTAGVITRTLREKGFLK